MTRSQRQQKPDSPSSRRVDGADFGEPPAVGGQPGSGRRLSVQRALKHPDIPPRNRLLRWLRQACRRHDYEITLRFVDEEEARALNRAYRGRDYATNVLSFSYDLEPVVRGDLVICMPVVVREASEQGKRVEAHCAHMVVHGLLHLQGLDHESEADAEVMERSEREILARLGFEDPYVCRNDRN